MVQSTPYLLFASDSVSITHQWLNAYQCLKAFCYSGVVQRSCAVGLLGSSVWRVFGWVSMGSLASHCFAYMDAWSVRRLARLRQLVTFGPLL